MKHRHKMKPVKKAIGGGMVAKDPMPMDAGGNKDVEAEAKSKTVGMIPGGMAKKRLDRARGGRVGADKSPLSANSSKSPITSAGKC
jgi:hypothetical protein